MPSFRYLLEAALGSMSRTISRQRNPSCSERARALIASRNRKGSRRAPEGLRGYNEI